MVGRKISQYKILSKLGEGGMGMVYKAEDTKLDRTVALKFLPHQLTTSETERARFLQEAKAASALNHPNVCTIHDIQEHEDEQFIVMEYVDGRNLREIVGAENLQPLPLNEVIKYALQIGEALKEAHANGIVHRDVKSENIMVNSKNQIKVMDFGLAKLKGSLKLTQTSSTVGTLAYMAPEQVQGKTVDARADIFSFGVVLYEMLAGQLPFRGDYEAAVIYSILNEEPEPIQKVRPELSSEFLHVLNRALEKESEDRYQTVNDMVIDLRRVEKEASKVSRKSLSEIPSVRQSESHAAAGYITKGRVRDPLVSPKPKRNWLLLGAIGGIILLLFLFVYLQRDSGSRVVRLANPRQITHAIGLEDHPTWSPDGGRLAYHSNQTGNWDIWVKQVARGEPVNMTADHSGRDIAPSWSPDGSQIAFLSDRDDGSTYVMPAIGGTPRKVAQVGRSSVVWSQDGRKLAYVARDSASTPYVEIYTLSTHEKQRVLLPGTRYRRLYLNWSPKEDIFAYLDANNTYPVSKSGSLWLVRMTDGVSWQVTNEAHYDFYPSWSSDGRTLYFISNRGGIMDLWQVALDDEGKPDGELMQVTNGVGMLSAAFSPDRARLAYSKGRKVQNLWRVPIEASGTGVSTWVDAQQLTSESALVSAVEISPDGSRVFFISDRSGNLDLWSMPVAGGELQQLTTNSTSEDDPYLSPDSRRVAFTSDRGEYREIWIMSSEGGPAQQITQSQSRKHWTRWSPDGQEIAFVSQDEDGLELWVVPAQGGQSRQISTGSGNPFFPLWWPDGKWLAFTIEGDDGIRRIWRVSIGGGQLETISDSELDGVAPDKLIWSNDGTQIYFIRQFENSRNVWSLTVHDRSVQQLTDFKGRYGQPGRHLATDGQYLYFTWQEDLGDIWVMDVEKEE